MRVLWLRKLNFRHVKKPFFLDISGMVKSKNNGCISPIVVTPFRKLRWLNGKSQFLNRKYVLKSWWIFHCHVSFRQEPWNSLEKKRKPWNPKQPLINGCFNWMIPNLYIGNGGFTKHLFINGCLGFQDLIRVHCGGTLKSHVCTWGPFWVPKSPAVSPRIMVQ